MLAVYKQKTNIGVGVGLALQVAGRLLMAEASAFGVALVVAGLAVFAWGCAMYAQGKGYHPALGLLGLLSLIGLLLLVSRPDRHPEAKPGPVTESNTGPASS